MIYPQDWKDIKSGRQSKEEYSKLHYPEWCDYLCDRYKNISFSEAAYLFYHNLEERPVCPECGSLFVSYILLACVPIRIASYRLLT